MKTQQSILDQAQQGDVLAIGKLMQAPLRTKGITVNTHLKNGLLEVNLVADTCPSKAASLSFIMNGIIHLNPQGIRLVRVDAYQTGATMPTWVALLEERDLKGPSSRPSSSNRSLPHLQGDRASLNSMPALGKLFIALGLVALMSLVAWFSPRSINRNNGSSTPVEAVSEP